MHKKLACMKLEQGKVESDFRFVSEDELSRHFIPF